MHCIRLSAATPLRLEELSRLVAEAVHEQGLQYNVQPARSARKQMFEITQAMEAFVNTANSVAAGVLANAIYAKLMQAGADLKIQKRENGTATEITDPESGDRITIGEDDAAFRDQAASASGDEKPDAGA